MGEEFSSRVKIKKGEGDKIIFKLEWEMRPPSKTHIHVANKGRRLEARTVPQRLRDDQANLSLRGRPLSPRSNPAPGILFAHHEMWSGQYSLLHTMTTDMGVWGLNLQAVANQSCPLTAVDNGATGVFNDCSQW